MTRCIDGQLHGALPHCPEAGCKGKLRIEGTQVVCGGGFREDVGAFVRCYFKAPASSVQRIPWRTGPKSEGKFLVSVRPWHDKSTEELKQSNEFKTTIDLTESDDLLDGLDMSTIIGKREAAQLLVGRARELGINVPSNEAEAKIKFGGLLMNNQGKTSTELLALAEQMFGTQEKSKAEVRGSTIGTVRAANEGYDDEKLTMFLMIFEGLWLPLAN